MKIERLILTSKFQFFWLKTVKSVHLSTHCANCLVGEYDKRIATSGEFYDLPLEDSVYYMCGVCVPRCWANNFHLAFRPAEGSTISVNEHGVEVVISGAERLPISPEFIDQNNKHAQDEKYYTCRNWQFAHYFAKNLAKK